MSEQTAKPDSRHLQDAIESLLLVAGQPVPLATLANVLGVKQAQVNDAIEVLRTRLIGGIRLQTNRHEAQLTTAPEHADIVHKFVGSVRPAPLSKAVLETLTVVAYHQPVTRAEIEHIRGVNSDRSVQILL